VGKRKLESGARLDGEGGSTVWGKLLPSDISLEMGGLPIGLAHDVRLKTDISEGQVVRWQDVDIDSTLDAVKIRQEMEASYRGSS
jgi:predicted homoserine dehydrogenase-like protein